MFGDSFDGAKIAILRRDHVLVILRDDKPEIAWPDCWDFPGGGREGDETPFETAARELHEELGLRLPEQRVFYHFEQRNDAGLTVHFFAATWDSLDESTIVFGDEGQEWRFMPVQEFLDRQDAIPHLQIRLRMALTQI